MRVCGLDVATKTGWCLATGANYKTGLFDCGKNAQSNAERNANFRSWLYTMLRANNVQYVAIERRAVSNITRTVIDPKTGVKSEKSITNDKTASTLAYLNECAQEVCFSLSIPFEIVAVNSWRSVFLGKLRPGPNEDWKAVAKRVCGMMGIEAKSKDAAEAAGVAFWLQVHLKMQRGQSPAGPLFGGDGND